MKPRPRNELTILDETVEYSDAGEATVREVIEKAVDHSSTSDELAAAATDWPTMYHLSPRRANIVAPLKLGPHLEILEVGAGTGAITRRLGESGAHVVALEGALPRAQSVAARCAELANVEVVCGSLDSFTTERRFDLVVVVGVLEYAGAAAGGRSDPRAFLAAVRALLVPTGALFLAIENRLGLKYLLGYAEDHLGLPWSGIEGYPKSQGIRTWSRRELAELLTDTGFEHQRWLYPYPDYKLPRAILTDGAFEAPDGRDLVDALVRNPIEDLAFPRIRFCDDRRAHRGFLTAGLGPEVANSFAIVAGADAGSVNRIGQDRELIAWHFGSGRLSRWTRHRTVMDTSGVRTVRSDGARGAKQPNRIAWLEQRPAGKCPWTAGPTLEQRILDALDDEAPGRLESVLRRWSQFLESLSTLRHVAADEAHPYLPEGRRQVLPTHLLDCTLANFVDTGSDLVFVDDEWHAVGGVDLDLARVRGLWYLALDMIQMGRVTSGADDLALADLVLRLARGAGIDLEPGGGIDSFLTSEAEFQSIVGGGSPAEIRSSLEDRGQLTISDLNMACVVPLARTLTHRRGNPLLVDEERQQSRQPTADVQAQISAAVKLHTHSMQIELLEARTTVSRLTAERLLLRHDVEQARQHLQKLETEIENHEAEQRRVGEWATDLERQIFAMRAHDEVLEQRLTDAKDRLNEAQHLQQRQEAEAVGRLRAAEADRDDAVDRLERFRRWYGDLQSRPLVRLWTRIGRLLGRQPFLPDGP